MPETPPEIFYARKTGDIGIPRQVVYASHGRQNPPGLLHPQEMHR